MGKVKISRAQAEAINSCKKDDEDKGEAIRHHINTWCAPPNRCLNELSVDELARALYVGYEVEVEVEVGDWLVNNRNGLMFQIEDRQEDKDIARMNHIRHATESEIEEEEKSRMDKKLDQILLDLSDGERDRLYEKLGRGDY